LKLSNVLKSLATLAVALTVALPLSAHAGDDGRGEDVTPPPVPGNIQVEAGNRAFLVGHATGTQNYVCLPSATGFAWSLFTPQATLFNSHHKQLTTHFFSPNPFEPGNPIRATWEHSRDTSTVWGQVVPNGSSTDPAFVAPGAIPWLLVQVVGRTDGSAAGNHDPSRPGVLTPTTFIQRLNTSGGSAPATGCAAATDVGKRAFVPYTADYFFYVRDHEDN
jgi:uncharacterized protein DUF3455